MSQRAQMKCPCCEGAGIQYVSARRLEWQDGAEEISGVRILCPTCKGLGTLTVEVQMSTDRSSINVN